MADQRAQGQKLINVPMDAAAIEAMNNAIARLGYPDRSKFIRDAICEKLKREGFDVPEFLFWAPPRVGKYPKPSAPYHLNEVKPAKLDDQTQLAADHALSAQKLARESSQKRAVGAPSGRKRRPKRGAGGHQG